MYIGSKIHIEKRSAGVQATAETIPVTVQTAATNQIRRWILDGKLAPGERLHQDQLAEALNVSRMPVREAIRQLASEGLVTVVAHRGAFVTSLDPEAIRELYRVRSALECLAIRFAVPQIEDATLVEVEQLLEQMCSAESGSNEEATIELDRRFHDELMDPAGMAYLQGLIKQSRQKSEAFRRAHTYIPGRSHISNQEHAQILAAVSARDAALAERLIDEHLTNAANHLIAFLTN
jgi:DNA-binding GntR family transcriptional regulator